MALVDVTGPNARFRFLDRPGPIAFAHRGGSAEAPENTWTSFSHAVDLGYRYLETDVQATADGVVAVIHDPTLDRVSDQTGRVSAWPWAKVSKAVLAGGESIPRLDDLLAAWPDRRWNIDPKDDRVVGPLVETIRRAGAVERVCVTSFSDRRLARVRAALGPQLCTGMGPRLITALRLTSVGAPVRWRGGLPSVWRKFGATQVPTRWGRISLLDARFVDTAHRLGLAVHVWTVDTESGMDRLLDLGVDGLMTDRPTLLRDVLVRRGRWDP